jgi:uncharacterized protein with GYD domain
MEAWGAMARYLTFFSYTGEATARMVARPEDRAEAARAVIEAAGGRLEAFYWTFGDHDGLAIYDVPDVRDAAAILIAASSSGRLRALRSIELLDASEIRAVLERARAVAASYEPPGGRGPWHQEYDSLG